MVGNEKRWFAVARTATKPENMQGFHEDNMLFIVDEASGVADPIMEAILGTLSGANNKLLMCGNPTRTSGTFYDAFNVDRSIYRCHTVSSADSKRTNKQNIESLIRKYGKDSNVVLVRVFGEFPKQEDDVFIALSIVEHCCMLDLPDDVPIKRISFGVDVATVEYGKLIFPNGTITVMITNISGFNAVENLIEPTYGRLQETDVELRHSYLAKSAIRSTRMIDSICSQLINNVPNVESATGYENDTDGIYRLLCGG